VRESVETKSFLRIGTKVRVREDYGNPYQRGGQSGTITQRYSDAGYTAVEVRLDNGRSELFWLYQLEEA
jgi:hypothetical protein